MRGGEMQIDFPDTSAVVRVLFMEKGKDLWPSYLQLEAGSNFSN